MVFFYFFIFLLFLNTSDNGYVKISDCPFKSNQRPTKLTLHSDSVEQKKIAIQFEKSKLK